MARPQKFTVDYFSHDAGAGKGKTLTILYNHFGHEGISGWWLLLEEVSHTNNHIISIRNSDELEYLAATLHFKPERLQEILDKMAALDAIDRELYAAGLIWCQNFIDRLAPVYKSRGQELPRKPDLKNITDGNNRVFITNNSINLPDNTQTKERERESKTKERNTAATREKLLDKSSGEPGLDNPDSSVALAGAETAEQDPNLTAIVLCYRNNIGDISPVIADELRDLSLRFSPEWFAEAVKEACGNNVRNLKYVVRILERWKVEGFKAKRGGQNHGTVGTKNPGVPGQKPAGAFSDLDV